jgi:hypothetical protein
MCVANLKIQKNTVIFIDFYQPISVRFFRFPAKMHQSKTRRKKRTRKLSKKIQCGWSQFFAQGSIHIWRQIFFGHFDQPTYPNQVLYYTVSLFSKIRLSLTYLLLPTYLSSKYLKIWRHMWMLPNGDSPTISNIFLQYFFCNICLFLIALDNANSLFTGEENEGFCLSIRERRTCLKDFHLVLFHCINWINRISLKSTWTSSLSPKRSLSRLRELSEFCTFKPWNEETNWEERGEKNSFNSLRLRFLSYKCSKSSPSNDVSISTYSFFQQTIIFLSRKVAQVLCDHTCSAQNEIKNKQQIKAEIFLIENKFSEWLHQFST